MLGPALASIAFGLLKGLTAPRGASAPGLRLQQDFLGPLKEEVQYRGVPFNAFGNLPYGSTAAMFAADHLVHDARQTPMTTGQLVARFGDVLLGGLMYETAYRSNGLFGAVAAHSLHNIAVGLGEKVASRRRR
jgi:membrane protease YdiL (CAAX protease family)